MAQSGNQPQIATSQSTVEVNTFVPPVGQCCLSCLSMLLFVSIKSIIVVVIVAI